MRLTPQSTFHWPFPQEDTGTGEAVIAGNSQDPPHGGHVPETVLYIMTDQTALNRAVQPVILPDWLLNAGKTNSSLTSLSQGRSIMSD